VSGVEEETGRSLLSRLQSRNLQRSTARNRVVGLLVGVYLLGVAMVGLTPWLPALVTTPPVVAAVTLVPGGLLLMTVKGTEQVDARWLVYAAGTGLALLLMVGLVLNLVLPAAGVDRPLMRGPILVALTVLVAVLSVSATHREGPSIDAHLGSPVTPAPLALALLPLTTVLGVAVMNRTGNNLPLIVVLAAVAIVPLAVVTLVDREWHAFGVWTVATAVLYHDALATGKTFPGNAVVVRTYRAALWVPGTTGESELATELLQHGTIFPMLARLTGLNIMRELLLVNPALVSVIPVALFVAYRRYLGSHRAVLAASVFIFAHPFYKQYPTAGRAATPVIFLSLFAVTLADDEYSPLTRAGLGLLFLSGVAVTHYGTSYFVMAAMAGAIAGVITLRILESAGAAHRSELGWRTAVRERVAGPLDDGSVFSLSTVAFFSVVVFSWFMYTNGGRAFELFPRHFTHIIEQFLTSQADVGQGRTGARIERNYGSLAVTLSKLVYMFLAALMGVGLTGETLDRFRPGEDYRFDNAFVGLGGTMLALFAMTLIVRTWGGGRPMMIAFVFALPFAVAGVDRLIDLGETVECRYRSGPKILHIQRQSALAAFGIVLAVLFVLNSGTGVVVVGMDRPAPGGVPSAAGQNYQPTDVSTHAWIIDHHRTGAIYGDYVARGQTDWFLPAIALRTEGGREYSGRKPRNKLDPLKRPDAGSGFILILGHNKATGTFHRGLGVEMPITKVRPGYRRSVIYTTGRSKVYYFNTST
jgi:uncharacterized membrane protein